MKAADPLAGARPCLTCGEPSEATTTICLRCGSDPVLPRQSLQRSQLPKARDAEILLDDLIRSPQEDKSLAVALLLAATGALLLSAATLGLFLLPLATTVARVILHGLQSRSDWLVAGPGNLPSFHNLSRTAAFRLGMRPVDIVVRQAPFLNAQTSGFGRQAWIVVDSQLAETMAADRAGLIATRDPDASCRALLKPALGGKLREGVSEDSFLASHAKHGDFANALADLGQSHPDIARRIRAIRTFWEEIRPREERS